MFISKVCEKAVFKEFGTVSWNLHEVVFLSPTAVWNFKISNCAPLAALVKNMR